MKLAASPLIREFFPNTKPIPYLGPLTKEPLAYRFYQPERVVLGKTMAEHLRPAVCYWHTFCWDGQDNFGSDTFSRPWNEESDAMKQAESKVHATFEFITKLGVPFFTFHDRDIAPEGDSIEESNTILQTIAEHISRKMEETGVGLLWGTANLFSHPRYLAGAASNPNPEIFAFAISQVKQALDVTHKLGGSNYVLWGGREGYDTLLNTDMKQESDQIAKFLSLLVEYKHKIGFKGTLLIEPKPCEPTKHQYDFDTATTFAFLQKYGLEKEFKVNIEANHATLAGHSFPHEIAYACAQGIFGSIDANRGDQQLGWDTDQFPIDIAEATQILTLLIKNGGFTNGGFNFDTKLRRQSIELEDIFFGHIGGLDTLAQGLLNAAEIIKEGTLQGFIDKRYARWNRDLGKNIMEGKMSFEEIAAFATTQNLNPKPESGRQEMLESILQNNLRHF